MRSMFITLIALSFCLQVSAQFQVLSDTIEIKSGPRYFKQGRRLNYKQLLVETQSIESIQQYLKPLKKSRDVGRFLKLTGVVLVGIPAGVAIAGGEPNRAMAAVGGTLLAIGLPVSFVARKKMKVLVEIHNRLYQDPDKYFGSTTPENRAIGIHMCFRF